MEAHYKDIYRKYRKDVKPLIAKIESERARIPDHVVPDTAMVFESIALSETPGLAIEERDKYIEKARFAIQHCESGCYQQLVALRLERIHTFLNRSNRATLMGIDRGTPYNVLQNGLKRAKEICMHCDTSQEASNERQAADLPYYKEAYEALEQPYDIVRKYEPDVNIAITATPRRLTKGRERKIAVGQGILWGLTAEGVIGVIRWVINRL